MIPLTMLSLLLSAPPGEAVEALDLSRLTFAEARRLDGKPVRVRFTPDSRPLLLDSGETIVEADAVRGITACIRFAKGVSVPDLDTEKPITVEGVIRARLIPARLIETELFPAVLDVELLGTRPAQTVKCRVAGVMRRANSRSAF